MWAAKPKIFMILPFKKEFTRPQTLYAGEGHGNPLQYPCLENPMDRGAWRATVQGGHKESDMTERLHFTSSNSIRQPVSCRKALWAAARLSL